MVARRGAISYAGTALSGRALLQLIAVHMAVVPQPHAHALGHALSGAKPGPVASVTPVGTRAPRGRRPNFLVLFVDDLGYNEINLGIDSVGHSVLTAAAVGGLPLNETTFAEVLRAQNYSTAMIGKWHLGVRPEFLPHARGFEYYLGVPNSVDMGLSPWFTDASGWPCPLVSLPLVEAEAAAVPVGVGVAPSQAGAGSWRILEQPAALQNLTARYVEHAARWMAQAEARGKPWLLYLAFNHVHNPQFCDERFCAAGAGAGPPTGSGAAVQSGHGGTAAAVREMDWAVGKLMAALQAAGAHCDENTLTLFTSDNGAPRDHAVLQDARGSNAPLSGFKGSVLEGGIRMPAMARWPGRIRAGSSSAALVATYDVFATLLALAHAPPPQPTRTIDGRDLSAILFEHRGARGHDCIFQYYSGASLAAVRCGAFKLRYDCRTAANCVAGAGALQLFDLEQDVGERSPLPNTTALWRELVANISAARAAHLATVVPVQDQLALGSDARYSLCAAPDSGARYPHLPNCTLTPANWLPPWPNASGTRAL